MIFSKNKTAEKYMVSLAAVQYYLKTKDVIFYSIDLYDNIVYNNRVKREFIYTEPFRKCWKAMGLGDDEQHYLENILLENTRKGAVI